MEREIKNKAASVRAKLMNIARAEKIDFDFLLLRYFQERFLYRLAEVLDIIIDRSSKGRPIKRES